MSIDRSRPRPRPPQRPTQDSLHSATLTCRCAMLTWAARRTTTESPPSRLLVLSAFQHGLQRLEPLVEDAHADRPQKRVGERGGESGFLGRRKLRSFELL